MHTVTPYDAILLYSFGGPNKPQDVVPFLRNVTQGKGIPDERLEQVGEHYYGFGGKSPINEQNLALKAALEAELAQRGHTIPVVWGNRNWEPYTEDALKELHALGAQRAAMLVTSAYASYSGCRQYREDMALVQQRLGDITPEGTLAQGAVQFDKVRVYFNHPGFLAANTDAVAEALAKIGPDTHIVYVTHSIPTTMEQASGAVHPATYSEQHLAVAREINTRLAHSTPLAPLTQARTADAPWSLAFCSRSGPPHQPWLEPDINDHLEELSAQGVQRVVIAPIGFISDHMEVIYDLDTEALATCERLGMSAVRADTAGTRPAFVAGLVDLIEERAAIARGEQVTPLCGTSVEAFQSPCPVGGCQRIFDTPSDTPTVGGEDAPRCA
ncbi:ferrochelatase [Jonesia quinghaiensis]|uniref:ferrochelatase n=1 Tax=Jonesia quinghaiensis TaxID=262806 RepID=UPI00042791C6|nr:ferrochelatase [Jonesia quinghaiensis]